MTALNNVGIGYSHLSSNARRFGVMELGGTDHFKTLFGVGMWGIK